MWHRTRGWTPVSLSGARFQEAFHAGAGELGQANVWQLGDQDVWWDGVRSWAVIQDDEEHFHESSHGSPAVSGVVCRAVSTATSVDLCGILMWVKAGRGGMCWTSLSKPFVMRNMRPTEDGGELESWSSPGLLRACAGRVGVFAPWFKACKEALRGHTALS